MQLVILYLLQSAIHLCKYSMLNPILSRLKFISNKMENRYIARTIFTEEDKEENLSTTDTKKFPPPTLLGNDPNSNQQVNSQ